MFAFNFKDIYQFFAGPNSHFQISHAYTQHTSNAATEAKRAGINDAHFVILHKLFRLIRAFAFQQYLHIQRLSKQMRLPQFSRIKGFFFSRLLCLRICTKRHVF